MALFGRKAPNAAPDTSADTSGAVAVADDDSGAVLPAGKRAARTPRASKAPRAPKAIKNGTMVGLNIGNQFIKAVEVTSKGGALTVTAMGAVATPPESYANGNVLSASALSGAVRELWRSAGIKSKTVVTSVAGTGALVVRIIEVPKMSDAELRDNMKVDADRYIPFPPSEVVMDFKALRDLPSDPDAPNMDVLLAAAQREVIDLHVKVVQSAKLDPRAIDVEPLAAARALQLEKRGQALTDTDYNEVTALVNIGATGTEISILRGDLVVFTRSVPQGGNTLTQAIADGLGLSFLDAEKLKLESADALTPAGFGAAAPQDDFSFGGGDFSFGGDFGGGDLNEAFNDITANPPTPGADDPFDLDFFNQNPPQNEPGAGHAQKEDDNSPFSFDFGDFGAPIPPASTPAPNPAPLTPAPAEEAPSAFDFLFAPEGAAPEGSATQSDAPAPSQPPAPPAPPTSTEKRTTLLEDFSFDAPTETQITGFEMPPAAFTSSEPTPASAGGAMPSAFDFDNFDLPAVQPDALKTVSLPVEPAAPTPAVAAPTPSAPASVVPGAMPATPAPFDFDDENLASIGASGATGVPVAPSVAAPDPFQFSLDKPAATSAPEPASAPTTAAPEPDSAFAFSLPEEPALAAPTATPTSSAPEPAPADPFLFSAPEEAPATTLAPAGTTASAASAAAAPAEDGFDLDALFGETAPVAGDATGAIPSPGEPALSLNKTDATPVAPAPAATPQNADDSFDIDALGGNAEGLGATMDDFGSFDAGLVSGGASTDAVTLYSLIYPPLEELSNEVRRSLEFHLGRYPDSTISRLVLLGGGAKLRNLDVFFTQMLGVPAAVMNPFVSVTVQTKLPPQYATENGALCAVALGLAVRDLLD